MKPNAPIAFTWHHLLPYRIEAFDGTVATERRTVEPPRAEAIAVPVARCWRAVGARRCAWHGPTERQRAFIECEGSIVMYPFRGATR